MWWFQIFLPHNDTTSEYRDTRENVTTNLSCQTKMNKCWRQRIRRRLAQGYQNSIFLHILTMSIFEYVCNSQILCRISISKSCRTCGFPSLWERPPGLTPASLNIVTGCTKVRIQVLSDTNSIIFYWVTENKLVVLTE